MRCVDRKTFLTLPPGVIYAKGVKWSFGDICVKGDSLGNDWLYQSFTWVDGLDGSECLDRLDEMIETGARYPMEDGMSRDGFFDDDAVFLVFEPADLAIIRSAIDAAMNIQL